MKMTDTSSNGALNSVLIGLIRFDLIELVFSDYVEGRKKKST